MKETDAKCRLCGDKGVVHGEFNPATGDTWPCPMCQPKAELSPAQRKELAGQLSASLAALPNVERTPEALLAWLEIDNTIVELTSMHAEAEERLAELRAMQPSVAEPVAWAGLVEDAALERDTIAAEIQKYMQAEVAKVDGIARFRHFMDRMVDGSKAEAKRAAARHKSWESRKASLDGFIMHALDNISKTRVESAANRLRIQNNPESVEITAPAAIGDEFVEVELRCTLADYKRLDHVLDVFSEMHGKLNEPLVFKRGQQTFKLSAIGAAIKETVKQPCDRCKGTALEPGEKAAVALGGPEMVACRPCLGTGKKRFAGARLTRSRHLRVE